MKQRIFKTATSFLLTAGMALGSIVPFAGTASADSEPDLSQFKTISREYDTKSGELLHYHYVDENGEIVDLNSSANTGKNSFYFKKAANIPSSYDLRTIHAVTPIKDQAYSESCWAFAALKSLESNQIMQGKQTANSIDLSENHLSWYSWNPASIASDPLYGEGIQLFNPKNTDAYMAGGSSILATFTLARWSGAVNEETAPFTALSPKEIDTMANTMAKNSDSLRYSNDYKLTDSICYDNASLEQIKSAIMEDGAMSVAFYYDGNDVTTPDGDIAYYQNRKNALANHCVTIVGWDDNYSKENFGTYKPASNGAWLVANSYGNEFGKEGYFWLSYEEPTIEEYYSFIATSSDTYDNNYQYDGFGHWTAIALEDSSQTKAANIFKANAGYNQSLKAIGIYTVSDNQPYTIEIYKNVTAGKPTSGTLAATISGTQDFEGFHTITLPKAVSLNASERFSVVITYKSVNKDTGYIPIEGESFRDFDSSLTLHSNPGESFLYYDDTQSWIDASQHRYNNVCLKAFTTNEQAVGFISFPTAKVTLGKNETYTAKAAIKNITDKTLTWKSSNKEIVTVSKTGKLTAKKTGTATITATLISGYSASFQVTVKKAPSKITVSPKSKTLQKNKSVQIKTSLPAGSASNKITYSSSKPSIAKVNASGKITGVKKGSAVITVKTFNKKKATIALTVK